MNARCSRCFKGEVITHVSGLVEALDQQKAKKTKRPVSLSRKKIHLAVGDFFMFVRVLVSVFL